jgi:tellurite resistance protein
MLDKRSDHENEYFTRLELEQREAIRQRLAAAATDLSEKRRIAQAAGTKDLELVERIHALGFTGENAEVIDILPLVYVAWIDGSISRQERAVVFHVLESRGIKKGHPASQMIEVLLEERPTDDWMEQALDVIKGLLAGHDHKAESLIDLCVAVAEASGGLFGLNRVAAAERQLVEHIAEKLGDKAQQELRRRLG